MLAPINQLNYNTDPNSKPKYFTSEPASQPKPIVIQRISFNKQLNKNDDDEKQQCNFSSLSALEFAVEVAKRDVQDEISRDHLKKIKNVNISSTDERLGTENIKTFAKKNNISASLKKKILTNLPARSFSPPTKDTSSKNQITNFVSYHKTRNLSSDKQVLEIEQMAKEIVSYISHLSQKLTSELKGNYILDEHDLDKIDSRANDRHIRINRLLYSLNTDMANIHLHFENNISAEQKILNQISQCIRDVLRVLRLLSQQINDWLKIELHHNRNAIINVNEHLANLISLCCNLFDICCRCNYFKVENNFQVYVLSLRNILANSLTLNNPKQIKYVSTLNKESEKQLFNHNAIDHSYANSHNNKENKIQNLNDNIIVNNSETSSEIIYANQYLSKRDMPSSRMKSAVNYISKNRKDFEKYKKSRVNSRVKLNKSSLAPPSSSRIDYSILDNNYPNQIFNEKSNIDNSLNQKTKRAAKNVKKNIKINKDSELNKETNLNINSQLVDGLKKKKVPTATLC